DGARADALVAAIRQRYAVALIDESQDTDPVQWRIFSTVFADAPLVLIGDPKQAIYGFRGADLGTYLGAAGTIPEDARHTLGESWRSEQRYLDAVNALFARDGVFGDDAVTAPRLRAAEARRERTLSGARGAPLRVRYVTASAAEADGGLDRGGAITKGWARRALPVDVAAQVVDLLASGRRVRRDGGEAPLTAGDLAVLTRTNHEADLVHAALAAAGVPATRARSGSVLASPEALALERLLEAVAQPGREPLARAAALTPPFGWTAGALLDPAREPAWEDWRAALAGWRATWEAEGVRAALSQAFAEQGAWPRLLAGQRGDRAVTNLGHLTERLHATEQAERLGPGALLAWLRRARAEALEGTGPAAEDAELRLERDDAAVQVATVHGAKGLEFGVVLCPFLWHASVVRDRDILRFHDPDDDERLTLDLHLDTKAEPKRSHLEHATREVAREDLRLAYVALTRAVHEAIVWWGPFSGASDSPLATLLAPSGPAPATDGDDDPARAAVEALAAQHEAIAVEALAAPPSPRRHDPGARRAPGATLEAASFARTLDRAWQRTSFTALTRAPRGPAVEGDEARELGRDVDDDPAAAEVGGAPTDARPGGGPPEGSPPGGSAPGEPWPGEAPAGGPPPDAASVPLAAVPRGPVVGDLLHRVLEHTDFAAAPDDDEALAAVVARSLRGRPELAAWRDTIVDGLTAALATPLGGDLGETRLADLARGDRLDELAFELPLAGGHAPRAMLTLADVATVLRRHDDGSEAAAALEALPPGVRHRPSRGYLTGSVDLVARLRQDGAPRYLVVDYKTTWLGDRMQGDEGERSTAWHYRPDALEQAMRPYGYHLQALLYLVAVHRHLRARLGRAYDPDRDLAGVAYLFLRGMTGPCARRPDGRVDGVWRWRPSAALVEEASALLAGGPDR
ncbi:MAG: UvrD-helicase domain-containing protein, partial [Actinomycetota bacterium]